MVQQKQMALMYQSFYNGVLHLISTAVYQYQNEMYSVDLNTVEVGIASLTVPWITSLRHMVHVLKQIARCVYNKLSVRFRS